MKISVGGQNEISVTLNFAKQIQMKKKKKVRALKRIFDGAYAVAVSQHMLREGDLRQEFYLLRKVVMPFIYKK